MNHLNININTYERDGETIIGDIHTIINQNDRLALIGPNGIGKSTLMRIISGQIHEYDGSIENIGGMTLGYLEQIHFMDESKTIRNELRDAFTEIRELEKIIEIEELKMADTGEFTVYTEALERYNLLGGYTYENEVERVARGIGIFDLLEKPLAHVSGGERTKIALAKILLSKPDFLLLDEPTNFIDLSSVEWLENYLEHTWKGGYIIVSHDREFLNQTCTITMEVLGKHGVNSYYGDYSYSVEERKKAKTIQEKKYEEQQIMIESEKKLINRFRAGSRAGFAKSRERQLEKIEVIEKAEVQIGVNFIFSYDKHGPETLIKIEEAFIGRHEPLFYVRSVNIVKGDRVGIVGENGVGKSTLLKTILGEMKALEGYLHVHENARILYFSQLHETLSTSTSIYDNFILHGLPYSRERVGSIISTYGFEFSDTTKIVGNLSGGERSRLLFALLSQNTLAWKHTRHREVGSDLDEVSSSRHRDEGSDLDSVSVQDCFVPRSDRNWISSQGQENRGNSDHLNPQTTEYSETSNILVLDEPTNHLDADTRESLERAIREYPGSVLFISHDRYFVNKLAEKLWIIEDGELIVSYGNYEDYRYKRERGIDLDMSLFNVDGEMDLVLEEKLGVVEARRIKEKFARRKKR